MTTPITQQFGVDATQAIAALDNFDQRMVKLTATIGTLSAVMNNWNQDAINQLKALGQSVKGSLNPASQATERLTTNFATLSRVVSTQAIVSVFRAIRQSIADAATEAVEFQRQVALVQTIAGGTGFRQIADGARDLADNFNIPLLDATAGVYQAISNQVGNFGESLQFTEKAAEFAKATNSSLADSVDLLSGALKSYQLNVNDTEKVSSIFFSVIDKGRITADELANSFGRIGPQAASLGVDLEEVGGALAAISVRGTNTAESLTQLRSILTALQKPTPEMRKALRDLGFTSAQTAIQTLGLTGVLRELEASTDGSAERLATLFRNVRGLSGVSALTSDELKNLTENIDEMRNASRDFSKEKFLIATATDAERVTKEFNKLKTAMVVGVGQAALDVADSFFKLTGGVDNFIALTPGIVAIGGAFAALKLGVAATNTELSKTSRILSGLAFVPVAIAAGNALGQLIGQLREAQLLGDSRAVEAEAKKQIEAFSKIQQANRDTQQKFLDERIQLVRDNTQQINRVYLQEVGAAQRANDELVTSTTATLGRILTAREGFVRQIANVIVDSQKQIEASQQRITRLTERTDDRQFSFRNESLTDAQQVFRLLERARNFAGEATTLFRSGDVKQIEEAIRLFDKAQGLGESAQGIADRANSRALEVKAVRELENLSRQQVSAEQELIRLQQRRAAVAEQERKRQQAIADTIRSQTKILLENTGVFDSEGNTLNETDLARRAQVRAEALQKIAATALTQQDLSIADSLGLADFVTKAQAQLSSEPLQLQFEVEQQTQQIQSKIKAAFANFRVGLNFDVEALDALFGTAETPDQVSQNFTKATDEIAKLRSEIDALRLSQRDIPNLQEQVALNGQKLAETGQLFYSSKNAVVINEGVRSLGEAVQRLAQVNEIAAGDVEKLIALRNAVGEAVTTSGDSFFLEATFSDELTALDEAIRKIQQLQQTQQSLTELPGLESRLEQLRHITNSIDPGTKFQTAASAIQTAVEPTAAIAQNWERAAAAAERVSAASARTSVPIGRQFGGLSFFADGGFARGTDTIPAMLSKKEMVINSDSSQRFFSQLQAINAGMSPVYRQDGGSVTNVGDINVTVQGGGYTPTTARQLALELRREMRRGSSRL